MSLYCTSMINSNNHGVTIKLLVCPYIRAASQGQVRIIQGAQDILGGWRPGLYWNTVYGHGYGFLRTLHVVAITGWICFCLFWESNSAVDIGKNALSFSCAPFKVLCCWCWTQGLVQEINVSWSLIGYSMKECYKLVIYLATKTRYKLWRRKKIQNSEAD